MNGYRAIGGWQRAKAMPVSVAWVAASISIGVAGLAAKQRQMGFSICFDHPENWSDLVAVPWHLLINIADPASWMLNWAAMIMAMMSLIALPMSMNVEKRSFIVMRARMSGLFMLGYLMPWIAAGIGYFLLRLLVMLDPDRPVLFQIAAFSTALCWQALPVRAFHVAACHRVEPLGARGMSAWRSAHRFGLLYGWRCFVTGWHIMLCMAFAPHNWAAALLIPLASIIERSRHRYSAWPGFVTIAALAIVALLG